MHIVHFSISNYKSFHSGPQTHLSPGINVIVGRNNVGKTAMIEALSLRYQNKPHRSLDTAPHTTTPLLEPSRINFLLEMGSNEFAEIVATYAPMVFLPTVDSQPSTFNAAIHEFQLAGRTGSSIRLLAEFHGGVAVQAMIVGTNIEAHSSVATSAVSINVNELIQPYPLQRTPFPSIGGYDTLPLRLAQSVQDRVYTFKAERPNLGEYEFGYEPVLRPDASNLARALNHLQTNPVRLQRFNDLVHNIFPDVTQVTVEASGRGPLRILVWTVDPATEREDLAVPLSESGTGIGQVLAMLYTVMTSEYPRIILIDEPQSFLHPGAVRKLIEVMRREARHEHQYVITTHSPAAVTAADPRTLLLVRKHGAESTVEPIDVTEAQQTRLFLAEVGARLGDVFGADSILWVEGPTEERCFPLILQRLTTETLLGTEILGVRSTGELEGRQARAAFEIYRRLIAGRGLLPPAVGFVFDREGRTAKHIEDLTREGDGKVYFLPRRMYENYLLSPVAIAAVASSIEGFVGEKGTPLSTEQVKDWQVQNRWHPTEGERLQAAWCWRCAAVPQVVAEAA